MAVAVPKAVLTRVRRRTTPKPDRACSSGRSPSISSGSSRLRERDAWYDPSSIKIGNEISFNRYFYKPQPLRTLDEIHADILALEKETEGLLDEIIGGNGR